ncbi:MAG: hypothetical protein Q4B28_03335 [bacterium]|nr:hypothetical protein [bacterium]
MNGKPQGMLRDKHLQIFATCDAPGWIYTWLPVPMWVNWRMRTHLSKIKLDGVKVFGNMHARKKSKTKMACLFADFRKRMQKMAGK